MGCEESEVLVDYYCFFFLSWLLASAFPSFPGYRSALTNLAGQEFASGLCGFAFFLFEFVYLLKIAPELRFDKSRNHGRHGK